MKDGIDREFIYDDTRDYEINLEAWFRMANDERRLYRNNGFVEPELLWDEAVITFRKMYGFKRIKDKLAIGG